MKKKKKGGVGGVSPINEQRYCSGVVKKKMRGLESDSLEGLPPRVGPWGVPLFFHNPTAVFTVFFFRLPKGPVLSFKF